MNKKTKEELIEFAQKEAAKAVVKGNRLFGTVLTDSKGKVIVTAHNTQNSSIDPTAHAEINLLRKASKKLKTTHLKGCRIFSNVEPCSMCMTACIKAQIRHFYYGASHEDVAKKKGKKKIYIYSNILKDSCVKQIRKGRKQNRTR